MALWQRYSFRSVINYLLKERQVYFRTDGEVRFLSIGKAPQVAAAISAVISFVWIAYTTGEYFTTGAVIADKEAHIADLRDNRQQLIEEMDKRERQYSAVAHKIEEKHARLSALLKQKAQMTAGLNSLRAELQQLQNSDREQLEKIEELVDTIGRQQRALNTVSEQEQRLTRDLDASNHVLSGLHREKNTAATATVANGDRIVAALNVLERQLVSQQSETYGLRLSVEERDKKLSSLAAEHATTLAARDSLEDRLHQLEAHLGRLQDAQRQLVLNIEERTEDGIENLNAILALTGLDPDSFLQRFKTGTGGPFEDLLPNLSVAAGGNDPMDGTAANPVPASPAQQRFTRALVRLDDRLERWQALNKVIETLPLATPVDHYHISSSFGRRRDPFTKRMAFHSGLDMAGSRRQAVYATAPGTVTFAGTKGPYGRMVEIDHGYGLKTRYGHLHKIKVKRGQIVDFRHKIGLLGSSGRSSGPHVHYEIHFDGKPVNPANFVKAGKHVFKS